MVDEQAEEAAQHYTEIFPNSLFSDPDRERAQRAKSAILQMRKLHIEALRRAADGAVSV